MAYATRLFNDNFLEYASYVIKDRAIPHLDDGLKPVQRRILHSLFQIDDGRFHKVANVVGHSMQYHPHGDASIYSALVVLANKDLFIDKQGNFGNIFTGDDASAARYIECRCTPLAKRLLYNPDLTEYIDSYDGRRKEPVTFPAKIPVILIQGAEGIAVGMSTRILPHNFNEVLDAVKASLEGGEFELFPDFPSGGVIDVSDYEDGMGKVLVRATLDTSDPKRILVKDLPYSVTTESLISSIENAARKGKIKIGSINDYTAEHVEIEIALPRGVYAKDVIDGLYAFTDCELSISVNLLVISDGKPVSMTVTEVIKHHAVQLIDILTAELELEAKNLRDRLHARTLERIFIEERIYKEIEDKDTQEKVVQAVFTGLEPFASQIRRKVTDEDVERLLRIPIRRISLYDINKAKQEMEEIKARLKEIKYHLEHIVEYAVEFIETIKKESGGARERMSRIVSFERVDVREAAARDLELRYDRNTGYLGHAVKSGKQLFRASQYDRILVIRADGTYSVIDVPEKLFVDKGMLYCTLAEKDELSKIVFTMVYVDGETKYPYIKRFSIEQFIIGKEYALVAEDSRVLLLTDRQDRMIQVRYKKTPRMKITEEKFDIDDYLVKSVRAGGVRLASKEIRAARLTKRVSGGSTS
jgi:topoisomerase IV subunit A